MFHALKQTRRTDAQKNAYRGWGYRANNNAQAGDSRSQGATVCKPKKREPNRAADAASHSGNRNDSGAISALGMSKPEKLRDAQTFSPLVAAAM
jgi:hypothetical protein